MNLGSLKLNPGAQTEFVLSDLRYSAFIGGLGSGKTFAGALRGLRYSLQPKPKDVFHPPIGVVAGASYRTLMDTIIPKLQEICWLTGVADWSRDWKKSSMELTLKNGAIIRLRSLDKPDTIIRGPEYSWAFIDEGRNVSLESWKLITSRLRQPGYNHAAWVASTPNGYDWMYNVFHEDGDVHELNYPDARWFNAPMYENVHLPEDYVAEQRVALSGRWYEQEFMGHFVGLVEGGVFPEWDPDKFCTDVEYNPKLPLYAGWDFGIGDPGVALFFQVEWVAVEAAPGQGVLLPAVRVIDYLEAKDLSATDWAENFKQHCADWYPGVAVKSYGDPAGAARRVGVPTSVIEDLRAHGVDIIPATKRSPDYAIRILSNMIAGGRVTVSRDRALRVSNAISTHKWSMDKDGLKVGTAPVHDWTSHLVDALRYGVSMIPLRAKSQDDVAPEPPSASAYGHVFDQLTLKEKRPKLGRPTFVPQPIVPRERPKASRWEGR